MIDYINASRMISFFRYNSVLCNLGNYRIDNMLKEGDEFFEAISKHGIDELKYFALERRTEVLLQGLVDPDVIERVKIISYAWQTHGGVLVTVAEELCLMPFQI